MPDTGQEGGREGSRDDFEKRLASWDPGSSPPPLTSQVSQGPGEVRQTVEGGLASWGKEDGEDGEGQSYLIQLPA